MTTQSLAAPSCPPSVLEWIAWYPDGELPADVRGEIEVHAAECAACRDEIASLAGDAAPAASDAPDGERVFARVQRKIAAHPRRLAAPRARRVWLVRPRVAIAASLVVAAISGTAGIVATQQLRGEPSYETATAGHAAPRDGAHLQVVFRDDVSFAEVSHALRTLGATVESGPSAQGVVELHLAHGADANAAAKRLESGDLRVAQFAQAAP